jgi:MFS family permease
MSVRSNICSTRDVVSRALRTSVVEGVFSSLMTGFTQEYLTPFLLLIGGSARHVGFLSAFPNLIASLSQLRTAEITAWLKSRRLMVIIFVFIQCVALLLMTVAALTRTITPSGFIALVVLFTASSAVAGPAWGSMMSDLVDPAERGRFFGWRSKILGFVTIGAALSAGLVLQVTRQLDIYTGFGCLFGVAFVSRLISWFYLREMYEPPLSHSREHCFTLIQFLRRLRQSNFAKFVMFVSMMSFTVNLASPFFAVLMLRELGFSYMTYTLVTLMSTFTIYTVIGRWGRHADTIGNLKIIRATAPLIALLPILWLFNRHPLYLLAAQAVSGFAWAGFNLCTSNFIYDAVTPEKRTRCIAYFNVFNGLALSLGALTGGFLLQHLPYLSGSRILSLFVVSSALRLIVGTVMPAMLKEVRPVEKVKSERIFFSMIGIRPMLGVERKTLRY